MHHIHTTDALVLSGADIGENSKFVRLYTQDLGLIAATVQGVREMKSKLRYSLTDFSLLRVSLVRGKEVWRITTAQTQYNFYTLLKNKREHCAVFMNSLRLVDRLITGEEKDASLYDTLIQGCVMLGEDTMKSEELKNFETLLILRILATQGLLDDASPLGEFIHSRDFEIHMMEAFTPFRREAVTRINRALKTL